MRSVHFWKYQSVGNDFVLVMADAVVRLQTRGVAIETLCTATCDRNYGIGSDGLLVLEQRDNGLFLRMFNPDGSEDFCGNGIRCAAALARSQGWVQDRFPIEHFGREVSVELLPDGRIATTLEPASFDPHQVPILSDRELFLGEIEAAGKVWVASAISTGTAHLVIPIATPLSDADFARVSSELEHHPLFPERTSIMWAQEIAPAHLKLRIWERGAGETLGCGTGSVASAIHWMRINGQGGEVTVENPGGTLLVSADSWRSAPVVTGEAFETFQGDLTPSFLDALGGSRFAGCC